MSTEASPMKQDLDALDRELLAIAERSPTARALLKLQGEVESLSTASRLIKAARTELITMHYVAEDLRRRLAADGDAMDELRAQVERHMYERDLLRQANEDIATQNNALRGIVDASAPRDGTEVTWGVRVIGDAPDGYAQLWGPYDTRQEAEVSAGEPNDEIPPERLVVVRITTEPFPQEGVS